MSGFLAVMRVEFRHVLRDPWALAVSILGTVLLMALLAYAVSADIEHIPVAVHDGDHSSHSRAFVQRFVNDVFFNVRYRARSHAEALELVRSRRVKGAIIVPPGFAATLQQGKRTPVQIIADGTEPNIALQITGNAEALTGEFAVDWSREWLGRAGPLPDDSAALEFRVRTLYNPEMREINTFLPGIMAIVLAFPAISAGLSLVREREQGSFETLLSTPIRRHQLLAGKVVPCLLIGLLDVFLLTAVGVLFFDVPFRGSLIDLALLSTLFLLANIGIGLLISSLLHTQMATLIVNGLVFMMPLTQSGLITPLYAMAPDARLQALLWPATHYVIIARGIFVKGTGIQELALHGLYLLVVALAMMALAAWRFKHKLA
jgi:ABC-2 type transport system permease protein